MSTADWAQAQQGDPELLEVIQLYRTKQLATVRTNTYDLPSLINILQHHLKLKLKEGVLYLKTELHHVDRNDMRLVLSWLHQDLAMKGCHDKLGYLGTEWMLDLLQDQLYWPGMATDTGQHVCECDHSIKFKAKPHREDLYQIIATHSLELIHIDCRKSSLRKGC